MDAMTQSLNAAQEIIDKLLERGKDYSKHKEQIARELFFDGLFSGNWSVTTNLEDPDLEDLHAIQEDEYDQSMGDDEKPTWASMICYVSPGAYVWFEYS